MNQELIRELRRLIPVFKADHEDIESVGFGFRRKNGVCSFTTLTLKVIVREKKAKPRPAARRVPRRLTLEPIVFGRKVRIEVPVDVETMPRLEFTVASRQICCLAIWRANSLTQTGFVTCGHSPRDSVVARCGSQELEGRLVQALQVQDTGYDIGLYQATLRESLQTAPAAVTFMQPREALDLLSNLPRDNRYQAGAMPSETGEIRPMQAEAYYPDGLRVRMGSGEHTLRHAVIASKSTFPKGTSGGLWTAGPLALACQVGTDELNSENQRGFGVLLLPSLQRLSQTVGGMRVSWNSHPASTWLQV